MARLSLDPPVRDYERILTGHFRSTLDYRCHRSQGTSDWLLIHTLSGEGCVTRNQKSIYCRPGELLLCRPHTPHDYRSSPKGRGWEIIWAHFHPRPEWLDWVQWPEALPGWHHLPFQKKDAGRIAKRLLEMHRRASRLAKDPNSEALSMNALEEVLLWADAANEGSRRPIDDPTRKVVQFLGEHHDQPLTLERLAQASGQSVARLTREFRRHTGLSVQVYLENFRLDRARQLLARTTLSIKEIAAQTGFQSPFYFSQRFKRKTGKSPRAYRS
jgi:AraC family transcriptional regulator, arabinose operon regulatory protein